MSTGLEDVSVRTSSQPEDDRYEYSDGVKTHTKAGTFKTSSRKRSLSSQSEADSDDASEHDAKASANTLNLARLLISLFAVVLLWCTSLRTVSAIVQAEIATPKFQVVYDEVEFLYNETRRVRQEYIDCVDQSLQLCNRTLIVEEAAERQRVREADAANVQLASRAETRRASCAVAHAQVLTSRDILQQQRAILGVFNDDYLPTCSEADKTRLQQVTADLGAQKAVTYQLIDGYSGRSKSTVGLLADQIGDRAAYDTEYLDNKTRISEGLAALRRAVTANFSASLGLHLKPLNISQMLACTSVSGAYGPCVDLPPGDAVRERLQDTQDTLVANYESAQEAFLLEAQRAAVYGDNAADMARSATQKLSDIAEWLDNEFPEYNGPAIEITGVSFNPAEFDLGGLTLDVDAIPTLTAPESLDTVAARAQAAVDKYQDNLRKATENLNTDGSSFQAKLDQLEVSGFEDYNPPQVDAHRIKEEHDNETDTFQKDATDSLSDIELEDEKGAAADKLRETNSSFSSLVRKARDMKWFTQEDYSSPDFDFDWLWSVIGTFTDTAFVIDIIYRLIYTVIIWRKFWGRSAMPVPPVDVQDKGDARDRGRMSPLSGLQGLAVIVTHPLVIGLVVCSFCLAGFYMAYSIYEPLFNAYYEGCVKTEVHVETGVRIETGLGTILAQNAYAISFNHASFDGNRDRLDGLDAYETALQAACTEAGVASARRQVDVSSQLQAIIDAHTRLVEEVALMRRCYDVCRLDTELEDLGIQPSFSQSLGMSSCADPGGPLIGAAEMCAPSAIASNASLENAVFNCANLPECDMHCDELANDDGKDVSGLRDVATGSACTAEWWAHAWVLKVVFVLIVYVFLNIFRALVIMGLCRLLWRQLNTGLFAFLGTAYRSGEATYRKKDLADAIAKMEGSFFVMGAAMVGLAIFSQVPWIVAMVHFIPKLTYDVLAR